MIIWGSRGVTSTKARLQFVCPVCRRESACEHKRVRRFFTLYFIPLIPLGTHSEYVECKGCGKAFDTEVLSFDPAAMQREMQGNMEALFLCAMTMVMCADGVLHEAQLQTIRDSYRSMTSRGLPEDRLQAEIDAALGNGPESAEMVARLSESMNSEGRELVFRAAMMVASADGDISESESEALLVIGIAMGMTQAHMNGIVMSGAAMNENAQMQG